MTKEEQLEKAKEICEMISSTTQIVYTPYWSYFVPESNPLSPSGYSSRSGFKVREIKLHKYTNGFIGEYDPKLDMLIILDPS